MPKGLDGTLARDLMGGEPPCCPLCCVQDALPEEGKAGAAIALALHEREAMDLAFGDAVAPLEGEPGLNGLQISLEPTGESDHCRDVTVVASVIHASRASPRRSRTRARKAWLSA
jgi:hypothetical protein